MTPGGTQFSGKQQRALAALLANPEPSKAARASKIARRTLYTWMRDPAFKAELDRMREEALTAALDKLKAACGGAADELAKLCKDPDHAIRRQACNDVLRSAFRQRELDVQARLEAIEAFMEKQNQ
jgi:hypothetical protein